MLSSGVPMSRFWLLFPRNLEKMLPLSFLQFSLSFEILKFEPGDGESLLDLLSDISDDKFWFYCCSSIRDYILPSKAYENFCVIYFFIVCFLASGYLLAASYLTLSISFCFYAHFSMSSDSLLDSDFAGDFWLPFVKVLFKVLCLERGASLGDCSGDSASGLGFLFEDALSAWFSPSIPMLSKFKLSLERLRSKLTADCFVDTFFCASFFKEGGAIGFSAFLSSVFKNTCRFIGPFGSTVPLHLSMFTDFFFFLRIGDLLFVIF